MPGKSDGSRLFKVLNIKHNAEAQDELKYMSRIPAFQPFLRFLESRVDQRLYLTEKELEICKNFGDADSTESDELPRELMENSEGRNCRSASEELPFLKKQIEDVSSKVEEIESFCTYSMERQLEEERQLNEDSAVKKLFETLEKRVEDFKGEVCEKLRLVESYSDSLSSNLEVTEKKMCSPPLDDFLESTAALQSHLNRLKKKVGKAEAKREEEFEGVDFLENLPVELPRILETLVEIERKTVSAKAKIFGYDQVLNCQSQGSESEATDVGEQFECTPSVETIDRVILARVTANLLEHRKSIMRDISKCQESTIEKLVILKNSAMKLRLFCDTLRYSTNEGLECVKLWRCLIDDYVSQVERINSVISANIWRLKWQLAYCPERTHNDADSNPEIMFSVESVTPLPREIHKTSESVLKLLEDADKICDSAGSLHALLCSSDHREQIKGIFRQLKETVQRFKELKVKIDDVERQYLKHKDFTERTPYQVKKDRFWAKFMENRSELVEEVVRLEKQAVCLQNRYALMVQRNRSSVFKDFA